ncbi:hypothetical protein BGW42_003239 [Actinomortierella wolfii]|nr:hypothetical protein BGW42_003239 [Actinomortierella wolfii]
MSLLARLSTTSKPTWRCMFFHSSRAARAINPSLRIIERVTKSTAPEGSATTATTSSSFLDPAATDSAEAVDPIFTYSSQFSSPLPARYADTHKLAEQEYPGSSFKSVSPLQAQLFKILMRMTRPTKVLELGCFMGYSAMALADGMDSHGVVYTCEKDEKAANLARKIFAEHNYTRSEQDDHTKYKSARIELLEGNAMDSLKALAQNNIEFDVIFIDADKGNYINYYKFILDNNMLARQGFILADNVLFRGLVLNSETASIETPYLSSTLSPSSSSSSSSHASPKLEAFIEKKIEKIEKAQEKQDAQETSKPSKEERRLANFQRTADHMHRFNLHVLNDERVEVALLPLFDGLSIIRRVK